MIDINNALQGAYITALAGIGVPVYWQNVPFDLQDRCYVVIDALYSSDRSDKGMNITETTVQLTVSSNDDVYNNGEEVNTVAGAILTAIVPTPQAKMSLGAGLDIQTTFISDTTLPFNVSHEKVYVQRYLRFKHLIIHN